MKKKILFTVVAFVLLLVVLFLGARYSWRLFGFRDCINPSTIYVESITPGKVCYQIKGSVTNSGVAFIGYTSKIEGEELYIGLKYNMLLGFLDRKDSFDIQVDCDTSEVRCKIYIVDSQNKKLIWPIKFDS